MERITDHVARALAKLPQQFKGKPNFEALLTVFCDVIQELEDGIWAVYEGTTLAGAIGDQLDVVGIRLGESRNGLTDDEYRVRLRIRIVRNYSKGEPERLIQVYKALMAAGSIQYTEAYPATFFINAKDAVGIDCENEAAIITAMEELRSGGVTGVYSRSRTGAFKFSGSRSGGGFGDATDPSVGGGLAYLLRTVCPVETALFSALWDVDTNPNFQAALVGAWAYTLDPVKSVSGDAMLASGTVGAAYATHDAAGDLFGETYIGVPPASGSDSIQLILCGLTLLGEAYGITVGYTDLKISKTHTAPTPADDLTTESVTFAANDRLSYRYVYATGVLTVYKNGVAVATATDTANRDGLIHAAAFRGAATLRTSYIITRS